MGKQNYSLKQLNTFGLDVKARAYDEFHSTEELKACLTRAGDEKHLILGGGSNILFTKDFDGWVIRNCITGKEVLKEDSDFVWIKVGAGENWHEFVLYCIEQGWGGLENMSLIPGVVGAAPIQNIGAYGVEQKDLFVELEALDKETQETKVFTNNDCGFGYRDSVFKNEYRNKLVILNVTYKLSKKSTVNISYGAISDVLSERSKATPSIKDVSDAVISIRQSKLPDPAKIGNAGSFFKNPVISAEAFENLLVQEPDAKYYKLDNGEYKIPAGWLIEYCGFKGKTYGEIGVHKNQALVLVNYGNGRGEEIFKLSEKIIETVYERFAIRLEREVNII